MATAGELIRKVRQRAGLTQSELAQRAGTSQAAVARYESGDVSPVVTTLERLLAAGGCRLDLQVDVEVPLVDHVMAHRRQIIDLAAAKGAHNVRLFGSAVRGQTGAGSDIDFLVEFDTSRGLWPMIELADELEQLLGRPVDVAPRELLRDEVAEQALTEAIPL